MKLEKQVVSLALAKKLKELGVKQTSLFRWCPGEMVYGYEGEWNIKETDEEKYFLFDEVVGREIEIRDFDVDSGDIGETDEDFQKWEGRQKKKQRELLDKVCSAFTCSELGEMLPISPAVSVEVVKMERGGYRGVRYLAGTACECCGELRYEVLDETFADTEVDARAKTLIYLLENNLIPKEEIK